MIDKIPAGTRIYLAKKNRCYMSIKPDMVITDVTLYVIYDVRINGQTVIPRGTRVSGDWVSESLPTIAAQLQINKIHFPTGTMDFFADSDVYESVTFYKNSEIGENTYNLSGIGNKPITTNTFRRIVDIDCKIGILQDANPSTIYIEIPTSEIAVDLIQDFTGIP